MTAQDLPIQRLMSDWKVKFSLFEPGGYDAILLWKHIDRFPCEDDLDHAEQTIFRDPKIRSV
jgi:hypothetical protein